MEDIKFLIDAVANLPTLAVWVLCGYLVYKVAVVGSVYGVIRFGLGQLFGWLNTRKLTVEHKEIRAMLDGLCIHDQPERLIAQLYRLRGKGVRIETSYIHRQDVDWLREAIDAKEALERDTK
jgi:uncharacterized membrane protein YhiD involved in acid resistance